MKIRYNNNSAIASVRRMVSCGHSGRVVISANAEKIMDCQLGLSKSGEGE